MSVIDELIFDRTQSDITNDTDKAYIDYKDLNRVEEAVKYLSDILNENHYYNSVNVKKWEIDDIRKQEDCERIKENYEILKNAYFYKFNVPDFDWETIEEANDIEKILFDINVLIKNMYAVFRYVNTFNSGGMEGLI